MAMASGPISFRRLRATLTGSRGGWAVPVDYYRLLRAGIYRLVAGSDPDLAKLLHTGGFSTESPAVDWRSPRDLPHNDAGDAAERFKLLCYSGLVGEGVLRQGQLHFAEPAQWFISTPLRFVADAIVGGLRQAASVRVGRSELEVIELREIPEPAESSTLTAVLLSPLVISAAVPGKTGHSEGPAESLDPAGAGVEASSAPRRRHYLTREDGIVITEARLRDNLIAKYRAVYGEEPGDPEFRFAWAAGVADWRTPDRPTRLVRLSGAGRSPIRVRGNLGAVTLAGSPEMLHLALHTGLGQHNASGMGFVLPEAELGLVST